MRDESVNTGRGELARYLSSGIQSDINAGMLMNREPGGDSRNGMVPVEVFRRATEAEMAARHVASQADIFHSPCIYIPQQRLGFTSFGILHAAILLTLEHSAASPNLNQEGKKEIYWKGLYWEALPSHGQSCLFTAYWHWNKLTLGNKKKLYTNMLS